VNAVAIWLTRLGDPMESMEKGVKEINVTKFITEFPFSLRLVLKICIHKAYRWRLK
jgi:hypothetical protein